MQTEALAQLDALNLDQPDLPFAMTLYDPNWHQGVIGILASRIRERVYRPTLIFADSDEGMLKASGRSIPGLHLRDALDQVAARHPGLLTKFGGHAMAAGLTLAKADFEPFCEAINAVVADALDQVPPEPVAMSDGSLAPSDLTVPFAEQLEAGGPWGQHFAEPVFDNTFAVRRHRIVGEKHLKLTLESGGIEVDAIAFNIDVDEWSAAPLTQLGALYRLDINDYRGTRSPQLVIEAFWPH